MSKSVGIVAEYNPFHTGHKHQMDFLKSNGYEDVAVAMSGSCVQRGQPALMSKFARAEFAIKCGASLVREIPFPFSVSSAEKFAAAGMLTLKNLGVDAVCFGSESGDKEMLEEIADFLLSTEYELNLKKYLSEKIPFAIAREKTITDKLGINRDVICASNDILAVEYIKACKKMNWSPEIVVLKRTGAGYKQDTETSDFASAFGIRKMLSEYRFDTAVKYIPTEIQKDFIKHIDRGEYFLSDTAFEKAVIFNLKQKNRDYFINIPDCTLELANAFEKALTYSSSLAELFENLPTKRYTHARLNRIILFAFINEIGDFPNEIQYVRILGINKNREEFLRNAAKSSSLPLSQSAKILSEKSENCKKIAFAEAKAVYMQSIFCKISGDADNDFSAKFIKI